MSASEHAGIYTHPTGQTPPWADTPLDRHPPPKQTATAADGTHHTGMHSCSKCLSMWWNNKALISMMVLGKPWSTVIVYITITGYLHETLVYASPWKRACYVIITVDRGSTSTIDKLSSERFTMWLQLADIFPTCDKFDYSSLSVPTTRPAFIEWQSAIRRFQPPPKILGQSRKQPLSWLSEPPTKWCLSIYLPLITSRQYWRWDVMGRKEK